AVSSNASLPAIIFALVFVRRDVAADASSARRRRDEPGFVANITRNLRARSARITHGRRPRSTAPPVAGAIDGWRPTKSLKRRMNCNPKVQDRDCQIVIVGDTCGE